MVTATPATSASSLDGSTRVKAPVPKLGLKSSLLRSQGIIVDFDAIPPPTSPLPIPNMASTSLPSTPGPSPSSPRPATRVASHEKLSTSSPLGAGPTIVSSSLRPPPRQHQQQYPSPSRPRSIVSHIGLSNPPDKSLPLPPLPVPTLLHTYDNLTSPSTPTSPTSPRTPLSPSFFVPLTPTPKSNNNGFSTSLPTSAMRSVSLGRVPIRSGRTSKGLKSNNLADSTTKDDPLSRVERITRGRPRQSIDQFNESTEDTTNNSNNGIANGNVNEVNTTTPAPVSTTQRLPTPPRPLGLIATQFYGIESSMRWREGVDPIQKRFSSSNGAWRCQDRFAIFFRPGDQIGPDQIVTKTFWSEAWPYPIETLLYGTVGVSAAEVSSSAGTRTRGGSTSSYSSSAYSSGGHSSDQEGDRQTTRGRVGSNSGSQGPRFVSSESPLKTSASFPSSVMTNKNRGGSNHDLSHKNSHLDPRYITSDGVQKIAKVVIPMPDIAIDQMDVVKAPIKVELRIFLLESPLRIHATAVLLGRTVAGLTELYI